MENASDFEKLLMFKQALQTAEATYAEDPLDADNLTRWGGILLELSNYLSGPDSKSYVEDSISKLEEALGINPDKPDALWCLGNAFTANGLMTQGRDAADIYFEKATQCLEQASALEPSNGLYMKSLEMAAHVPEVYEQIHSAHPAMTQPGPSASTSSKQQRGGGNKQSSKSSDLKYDICGWVILAVGIFVWVGLAKANAPPAPHA